MVDFLKKIFRVSKAIVVDFLKKNLRVSQSHNRGFFKKKCRGFLIAIIVGYPKQCGLLKKIWEPVRTTKVDF